MKRLLVIAVALTFMNVGGAHAMNCNAVFDDLQKAISGHLTMDTGKRVALTRMATGAFDHCMAGDHTSAKETRSMIMAQIRKSLGGN